MTEKKTEAPAVDLLNMGGNTAKEVPKNDNLFDLLSSNQPAPAQPSANMNLFDNLTAVNNDTKPVPAPTGF